MQPVGLRRASARGANKARCVAVVHTSVGAILASEGLDVAQRRNVAVHRKDSVGHDQLDASAGIACRNELPLQVFHVHVAVAEPFRLAQPNPVNNGCVIKFVGQHGIVRPQQRLEEPSVRVKARGVKDGVLHAEVCADRVLQATVQILRAANKAHGREPKAVAAQRVHRGARHLRVVAEPQVVVGAEVKQRRGALRHTDSRALR
mmetsp:Transcript_27687/g.82009  ORF Transcript_27687/g.82009 Transcript_27687/m.82009 type:complete len:204 (+) Transcript_27687:281-892(+)